MHGVDECRVAALGPRIAVGLLGRSGGRRHLEIGDPPHRQPGRVGDLAARVAGHGQWQGSDGCGADQRRPVRCGASRSAWRRPRGAWARCWAAAWRRPSSRPGSARWRGVHPCRRPGPGRRRCHLCRSQALSGRTVSASPAAPAAGIHMTKKLSLPPEGVGGHAPHQRSTSAPGSGDTSPQIMINRGGEVMPPRRPGTPIAGLIKKVMGEWLQDLCPPGAPRSGRTSAPSALEAHRRSTQ